MTYILEESKVVYQSKNGKEEKVFDALEWLAAMCSHVPNKGEQMVCYYGYYSNVSRGKRKQKDQDDQIPSILEADGSSSEYRKNWARLPALARLIGTREDMRRYWKSGLPLPIGGRPGLFQGSRRYMKWTH